MAEKPQEEAVRLAHEDVQNRYRPGDRYRHYKGGLYEIVCGSLDEATLGCLVTYRSVEKGYVWTRVARVFDEDVWVDGKLARRFDRVSPEKKNEV